MTLNCFPVVLQERASGQTKTRRFRRWVDGRHSSGFPKLDDLLLERRPGHPRRLQTRLSSLPGQVLM